MIVGLTGGIGSGKSVVAKLFELLGCAVFNSDESAKKAYFEEDVRAAVMQLLGTEAYLNDCELNRKHIGEKIFSDPELLRKINALIHPAVKRDFEKFISLNKEKIIVKETALLFEANIDKEVDRIIMVAANDELRITRVMKRDGLTREQVISKMKAQLSQEEKIKRSHFVIYNNEEEFLITQVLSVYNQLNKQDA